MTLARICDICGKPAKKYTFTYDRKLDAAGSMDDVYKEFDLCDLHYTTILSDTIRELGKNYEIDTHDINSILIRQIQERKK